MGYCSHAQGGSAEDGIRLPSEKSLATEVINCSEKREGTTTITRIHYYNALPRPLDNRAEKQSEKKEDLEIVSREDNTQTTNGIGSTTEHAVPDKDYNYHFPPARRQSEELYRTQRSMNKLCKSWLASFGTRSNLVSQSYG